MLPRPEVAGSAARDSAKSFLSKADAAYQNGVWMPDGSRHTIGMDVDKEALGKGTMLVQPKEGMKTLRVAYFFSGVTRKASIADELRKMCEKDGHGLQVFEVDVLVGGSEHDLLDRVAQDAWLARLEAGEFDAIILSPPCGSWSRANWANEDGPAPCRSRKHPWGFPNLLGAQRRRAESGNEFVHFSICLLYTSDAADE